MSQHRTSCWNVACHVPDKSQLTQEEEQRQAPYLCTLSPEHRCIPCSHNVIPHLSAICYGCQPVQLQQQMTSISYDPAGYEYHTGRDRGCKLILTGSAERVASITPFFSSSSYLSARRPISVVQTGCSNMRTSRNERALLSDQSRRQAIEPHSEISWM